MKTIQRTLGIFIILFSMLISPFSMLISPVQAKENTSSNWMQSISGDTKLGALRFQVHMIQPHNMLV